MYFKNSDQVTIFSVDGALLAKIDGISAIAYIVGVAVVTLWFLIPLARFQRIQKAQIQRNLQQRSTCSKDSKKHYGTGPLKTSADRRHHTSAMVRTTEARKTPDFAHARTPAATSASALIS